MTQTPQIAFITPRSTRLTKIALICVLFGLFCLPFSAALANFIVVGSVLTLLAHRFSTTLSCARTFKMNSLAVAFILVMAICAIHSSYGWHRSFSVFEKYNYKIMLLFVLPLLFINPRHRQLLLHTFLISAISISIGYTLYLTLHTTGNPQRTLTDLIVPIPFSMYCAMASALTLDYLCDTSSQYGRILYGMSLLWLYYFLYFVNHERTGMLVALLLLGFTCLQRLKWKGVFVGAACLLVIPPVLYYASPIVRHRVEKGYHNIVSYQPVENRYNKEVIGRSSLGQRLLRAETSWAFVKKHPWLGYGVGSFKTIYPHYATEHQTGDAGRHVNDPDNQYVLFAVEIGLVGLGIYLLWLAMQWMDTRALPNQERWMAQKVILALVISSGCTSAFLQGKIALPYIVLIAALFAARFNHNTQTN